MKLTRLSVSALLVLSCAAAFGQTTVKLGFLSHDQQTQYCDYVQLTVEKNSVVTGTSTTECCCEIAESRTRQPGGCGNPRGRAHRDCNLPIRRFSRSASKRSIVFDGIRNGWLVSA